MTKTTKSLTVPCGKFKGQPIEVLAEDAGYRDWITAQGWFRERYPEHYTVIINNFHEPDETPEHNALQAAFLDTSRCLALARLLLKRKCAYEQRNRVRLNGPRFECAGWDVSFSIEEPAVEQLYASGPGELVGPAIYWEKTSVFAVELKPTLGDDYPAVLRAVKARGVGGRDRYAALVYEQFTGRGAPIDAVTKIFRVEGVEVVRFDEIEVVPVPGKVSP